MNSLRTPHDEIALLGQAEVVRVVDAMAADIELLLVRMHRPFASRRRAIMTIVEALTGAMTYGGEWRWRDAYSAIAVTIAQDEITTLNGVPGPSQRVRQFLLENRDLLKVTGNA